jgi:hypothetical protein
VIGTIPFPRRKALIWICKNILLIVLSFFSIFVIVLCGRFGHLVDTYAWNPHCRYLDGKGSDGKLLSLNLQTDF